MAIKTLHFTPNQVSLLTLMVEERKQEMEDLLNHFDFDTQQDQKLIENHWVILKQIYSQLIGKN
jgi:hypothetical protein